MNRNKSTIKSNMVIENNFEIASPPSETILRRISDLKIDLKMFRDSLDLNLTQFGELIHDQFEINAKLAYQLSRILGGSETFWKNRYVFYLEELNNSNKQVYEEYKSVLDQLCRSRKTNIENLLRDFRYSSLEHLVLDYFESPVILYSRTQRLEPSPIIIANWIRECEMEAEDFIYEGKVSQFSNEQLRNSIAELISFSKINHLNKVIDRIQKICFDSGVILLCRSSHSGNGISGFTKRLLNNYRLVVVTDRYKNNAAFWFTFLHELSHCILHDLRFPLIHFSDDEFKLASLRTNNFYEEEEADNYVESLLFPEEIKKNIRQCNSYNDILKLAVQYDISASLIVAQIHREKLAPYNWYRKVYRRVEFNS